MPALSLLLAVVLVLAVALALAAWKWRRDRAFTSADASYPPIRFPLPDPRPDPPPPAEREVPQFYRPHILGDVLPVTPECGLVYPLVYNDLVKWEGARDKVDWVRNVYTERLLRRAREEARLYCLKYASQGCRGVTELDYTVSAQLFDVGTTAYVNVNIVYLFRCAEAGSTPTGIPYTDPVPFAWPPRADESEVPLCNGSYQLTIHDVSELAGGCNDPDRAAIEQNKAARLLREAHRAAGRFCGRHPEEMCTTPVEDGHTIAHHCFRSAALNATYHVSTIVYLFGCPYTT